MEKYTNEILEYPIQNKLTQNIRKQAIAQNKTEFMSMWAGHGVHLCKAQSVVELMKRSM